MMVSGADNSTSGDSESTGRPVTDTTTQQQLTCEDGEFIYSDTCYTCHCKSGCDCSTQTDGCDLCNDKQVCAVGYTDFPLCQTGTECVFTCFC